MQLENKYLNKLMNSKSSFFSKGIVFHVASLFLFFPENVPKLLNFKQIKDFL